MKSLFKVTLLATTMAVALNAPLAMAADTAAAPQAAPAAAPQSAPQAPKNAAFKDEDQQSAYALGASLGRYMDNSLKEQENWASNWISSS